MTPEQQQYFDAMDALFNSVGWQLLAADLKEWMDAISSQWETITPDGLRYEQGRYSGIKQVAELPKFLEGLKDSINPVEDN